MFKNFLVLLSVVGCSSAPPVFFPNEILGKPVDATMSSLEIGRDGKGIVFAVNSPLALIKIDFNRIQLVFTDRLFATITIIPVFTQKYGVMLEDDEAFSCFQWDENKDKYLFLEDRCKIAWTYKTINLPSCGKVELNGYKDLGPSPDIHVTSNIHIVNMTGKIDDGPSLGGFCIKEW